MSPRADKQVTFGDIYGFVSRNSSSGCNYLSPLMQVAAIHGWTPDCIPADFLEVIAVHRPKSMDQQGFANTLVRRFNEAAMHFGLPTLAGRATARTARAAANAALHPNILAEIDVRCHSLSGVPETIGNARRRLLGAARAFDAEWPLSSFIELAEPLRLDAFVRSFEPDPAATLTIHTGRKRALAEVANLLDDLDCEDDADAIREMISCFPKTGLAAAKRTEDRVLMLDESDTDDILMGKCENAIATFVAAPGRETMWAAQAALGSLIILKEPSDLDTIWQASFSWQKENLTGSHYPILTIPPKPGQIGWIDVTTGDDTGWLFRHIQSYGSALLAYKHRRAAYLFETIGGRHKKPSTVSNDIYRFWRAHNIDTSPTALRDHVLQQSYANGCDWEDLRNLAGGATVDNVRFRFHRLVRQRVAGDVADAMERAHEP